MVPVLFYPDASINSWPANSSCSSCWWRQLPCAFKAERTASNSAESTFWPDYTITYRSWAIQFAETQVKFLFQNHLIEQGSKSGNQINSAILGTRSGWSNNAETHRELSESVVILITKTSKNFNIRLGILIDASTRCMTLADLDKQRYKFERKDWLILLSKIYKDHMQGN